MKITKSNQTMIRILCIILICTLLAPNSDIKASNEGITQLEFMNLITKLKDQEHGNYSTRINQNIENIDLSNVEITKSEKKNIKKWYKIFISYNEDENSITKIPLDNKQAKKLLPIGANPLLYEMYDNEIQVDYELNGIRHSLTFGEDWIHKSYRAINDDNLIVMFENGSIECTFDINDYEYTAGSASSRTSVKRIKLLNGIPENDDDTLLHQQLKPDSYSRIFAQGNRYISYLKQYRHVKVYLYRTSLKSTTYVKGPECNIGTTIVRYAAYCKAGPSVALIKILLKQAAISYANDLLKEKAESVVSELYEFYWGKEAWVYDSTLYNDYVELFDEWDRCVIKVCFDTIGNLVVPFEKGPSDYPNPHTVTSLENIASNLLTQAVSNYNNRIKIYGVWYGNKGDLGQ